MVLSLIYRVSVLVLLLVMVSACTVSPPKNQNNLCEIFREKDDWYSDEKIRKKHRKKITYVCAVYLSQEKRKSKPYDPVTRFHLGNGAEIEKINWEADISERGLKQSAGLMVNYKYNPLKIISNHESYVNEGKIVLSSKVKRLLH